ncbi:uncharacterized protein LOC125510327 [Triticum urartu]|uniref:uncharacterized protein LOC125510327 n=1 Tax=Triticum urartu TaxID=4572 RepID=UPI0020448A7E|nr:uncharacterized protein LOC125510327 [Triticum urartu]
MTTPPSPRPWRQAANRWRSSSVTRPVVTRPLQGRRIVELLLDAAREHWLRLHDGEPRLRLHGGEPQLRLRFDVARMSLGGGAPAALVNDDAGAAGAPAEQRLCCGLGLDAEHRRRAGGVRGGRRRGAEPPGHHCLTLRRGTGAVVAARYASSGSLPPSRYRSTSWSVRPGAPHPRRRPSLFLTPPPSSPVGGRQPLRLLVLEVRCPQGVVVGGVPREGALLLRQRRPHAVDLSVEEVRARVVVGHRGNGDSTGIESPPCRPGAHVRRRRDVRLEKEIGLPLVERVAAEAVGRRPIAGNCSAIGWAWGERGGEERRRWLLYLAMGRA